MNIICAGQISTLTASGATTYTWDNGTTTVTSSQPTFTPNITTSFTVTGTSTNGCSTTTISTVIVNQNPTVSVTSSSATICTGNVATLTALGADTYVWTNSSINASTTFSSSITGTYVIGVTGTNTLGCSNTATITQAVITCTTNDVGISEYSNNSKISLYPNPSNGEFNVTFPGEGTLQIIDMSGRLIYATEFNEKLTVTESFATGYYTVQIQSTKFVSNAKLIIAK